MTQACAHAFLARNNCAAFSSQVAKPACKSCWLKEQLSSVNKLPASRRPSKSSMTCAYRGGKTASKADCSRHVRQKLAIVIWFARRAESDCCREIRADSRAASGAASGADSSSMVMAMRDMSWIVFHARNAWRREGHAGALATLSKNLPCECDAHDVQKYRHRRRERHDPDAFCAAALERDGAEQDVDDQAQHFRCQPALRERILAAPDGKRNGAGQQQGVDHMRHDLHPSAL